MALTLFGFSCSSSIHRLSHSSSRSLRRCSPAKASLACCGSSSKPCSNTRSASSPLPMAANACPSFCRALDDCGSRSTASLRWVYASSSRLSINKACPRFSCARAKRGAISTALCKGVMASEGFRASIRHTPCKVSKFRSGGDESRRARQISAAFSAWSACRYCMAKSNTALLLFSAMRTKEFQNAAWEHNLSIRAIRFVHGLELDHAPCQQCG